MTDKPRHLRELFVTGKKITVTAVDRSGEPVEFEIWLRKPTPADHQEVSDIAGARAARVKAKYKDKDSEQYQSLFSQIEDETAEDLIKILVDLKVDEFRREAFNKVLHDEDYGSDWSPEGRDYLNTVLAMTQRLNEIESFNASLSEEDVHLIIRPEDDEELSKLSEVQEEFEKEVLEYIETLSNREKMRHGGKSLETLRKEIIKILIDIEINIVKWNTYKSNMVWRACREIEDKKTHYFKDVDELESYPTSIKTQIYNAYDEMDFKGDDIKNLLSLLPSSI